MAKCTICSSGNEPAISAALCKGASHARVAKLFHLNKASVGRHARSHISLATHDKAAAVSLGTTVKDLAELKLSESSNLLAHLVAARQRVFDIGDRARKAGDLGAETASERGVLLNLELTAKLLALLGAHTTQITQSLTISPDYFRLRSVLLQALIPFREARLAVAAALLSSA